METVGIEPTSGSRRRLHAGRTQSVSTDSAAVDASASEFGDDREPTGKPDVKRLGSLA
jgi:hypothetical protein